jgi:hypothetical protein
VNPELASLLETSPEGTPWQLDWEPVRARLAVLAENPSDLRQGGLNLCGPATFFRIWIGLDPIGATRFARDLYETGTATLGEILVQPRGNSLLSKDYAHLIESGKIKTPPAEWMMMGALRDSENAVSSFDGDGWDTLAGITTPAELTRWLAATGLFKEVREEANSLLTQPLRHAQSLRPEVDVIAMLTHERLLKSMRGLHKSSVWDFLRPEFPNHWVVLEELSIKKDQTWIQVWSWGQSYVGEIATEEFLRDYYGSVIAVR